MIAFFINLPLATVCTVPKFPNLSIRVWYIAQSLLTRYRLLVSPISQRRRVSSRRRSRERGRRRGVIVQPLWCGQDIGCALYVRHETHHYYYYFLTSCDREVGICFPVVVLTPLTLWSWERITPMAISKRASR